MLGTGSGRPFICQASSTSPASARIERAKSPRPLSCGGTSVATLETGLHTPGQFASGHSRLPVPRRCGDAPCRRQRPGPNSLRRKPAHSSSRVLHARLLPQFGRGGSCVTALRLQQLEGPASSRGRQWGYRSGCAGASRDHQDARSPSLASRTLRGVREGAGATKGDRPAARQFLWLDLLEGGGPSARTA
jgi:hypothetical protein